jgi:hypothetical protein
MSPAPVHPLLRHDVQEDRQATLHHPLPSPMLLPLCNTVTTTYPPVTSALSRQLQKEHALVSNLHTLPLPSFISLSWTPSTSTLSSEPPQFRRSPPRQ